MDPRWHRTGSPTWAVAEEKLGSLMVHRKSVPAGTSTSWAAARYDPHSDSSKTTAIASMRGMRTSRARVQRAWSELGRREGAALDLKETVPTRRPYSPAESSASPKTNHQPFRKIWG